jgi:hypothetical protein
VTVLGAGSVALAGDKLHFSAATDSLDLPVAEKADSGADQLSLFHNIDPRQEALPAVPWAMPSEAPTRRKPVVPDFWQNGSDNKSFWSPAGPTNFNDSYNTTNQLSAMKPWSPAEQDANLRRSLEGSDSHLRPGDRPEDAMNSRDSHNALSGPGYGSFDTKDWAARPGDGFGANRATARDLFHASSALAPSTRLDSLASKLAGFSGANDNRGFLSGGRADKSSLSSYLTPRMSAFDSPSTMPASAYNAPFSGVQRAYGPNTTAALREPLPGEGSPIGQSAFSARSPGLESLDDALHGGQRPGVGTTAPLHKALTPTDQLPGQQPRNGLDLPWPKRPGAIMN